MRLNELIDKIEAAGFTFNGDKTFSEFAFPLVTLNILCAPMVLIPREPPVKSECVMVPNLLTWPQWTQDGRALNAYVRIEGGVALDGGRVAFLQFVRNREA